MKYLLLITIIFPHLVFANLHRDGLGVEKDSKKAAKYLKLAAKQDDPNVQNKRGGKVQNRPKTLHDKNKTSKNSQSKKSKIIQLSYGIGVEKDLIRVVKYFKIAEKQGDPNVQNKLDGETSNEEIKKIKCQRVFSKKS